MSPQKAAAPKLRQPKQIQHRISPDERQELIDSYRSGQSVVLLATKFKIHRTTVTGILARSGTQIRQPGLANEQILRAIDLYKFGNSLAAIGSELGVDAETVRRYLKSHGVTMRAPGSRRNKRSA